MQLPIDDFVAPTAADPVGDMPGLTGPYDPPPPPGLPKLSPVEFVEPLPMPSNSNGANVQATEEHSLPATPIVPVGNPKRKRAGKADIAPSELAGRRQAVESRIAALEAVLDAAESVPPTLTAPVQPNSTEARNLRSAARDVYYFVTPVNNNDDVPEGQIDAEVEADTAQQSSVPFDSLRRPQSNYLRCRPCLRRGITKIWVNRPGGLTRGLREHMERHHPVVYYNKCREEGLNHVEAPELPSNIPPEFSRAGLVTRLVEWIAINDQPPSVLENPEFRDVLLYCGQGAFNERDIPHRDKLAAAAFSMYLVEKDKIDAEMKCALGRISLTSDLWSDLNLRSFMSVTAHYINETGELVDRLIAFRKVDGHHTGANVGQVLCGILLDSGIADKIGCITLDNASNNNTLMQELAQAFEARGIEFNEKENRIRACQMQLWVFGVSLLSAEKTPTLSLAFPVYESMVEAWGVLREKVPELQCPINSGIDKIRDYVNRTREAAVHTLAMVLNPAFKFEWINSHWGPFDRHKAYELVKAKMLLFQRQSYERSLQAWHTSSTSTRSQNHGYLRVLTLGQNLRRASSFAESTTQSAAPGAGTSQESVNALPVIVNGRLAPSPEDIRTHNIGAVEFELNRYIRAGTIPIESMGAISLADFWRANQYTYPLLYRIAMDVLPVQASSVSSERVFSSSKLTCTPERNRISTQTMEAFQVLKNSLHRRRREAAKSSTLDFVAHKFENLEIAD